MDQILTRPGRAADSLRHVRDDFPILSEKVHGKDLVFLDSAASAQKPRQVIDCMAETMRTQYANIHRGLYWMSERTTEAYEGVRDQVAKFLGANAREEIVFTRNSTEAINLVAHSYGSMLRPGQAVVVSEMEHHANLVPWQMLRDRTGIELRVTPVTDDGALDMDALARTLSDGRVGLVAITHMSNVLGTITDARAIADMAHAAGAKVLFDGSQLAVHRRVDVSALDADFYVVTGHKLYGPTGIGVLWARRELLEAMPPFLGGGDMISTVSFERSTWAHVPHKFEAGTPAIIETIGLGAALAYIESIGFDAIGAHEDALTAYALEMLGQVQGLKVIGTAPQRGGVISFTMADVHPHDIATLLDRNGIAVRAGHHCAEPLMRRMGVSATARASFGIYTTPEEIATLAATLEQIRGFFV
ncbi:cysteine desulfurase [Komagataeibacter rhaeticus]|uniref:aminotransferase class V-fold PLP-dependent enzyme n=1 Tax=Komagataeibacter rhaeticus TaxID=215221 RepID=UPI0004DAF5D2|nr:cysteine desulfurase [Komagataeibacter rhaeticus]KDU95631.1 cysteine desulfurase [Komagataeibacter rhaeticus AF1]MBL7241098.1 cysteine desulfurase [Komagataeibacter rhaeticus]PYD54517.1 cysteine desulfurase [Komagataeibacter rhaeticus]GBQ15603.1 cysteine desulfurase [Komagataeibacter rhaeticus DSM 16663]